MDAVIEILVGFDVWLMFLFNETIRNPIFNWVMPIFDYDYAWRLPLFTVWILVMIFGNARARWVGLGALIMVGLTDPISARMFKPWIGRIRPCNVLSGLNVWWEGAWVIVPDPVVGTLKGSPSFPSSHAANIGGQAFWWGWAYPKGKWVFAGLAVLIGFSRIYDGVHYPLDVFGGYVVGLVSFIIVWYPTTRWGPKLLSQR